MLTCISNQKPALPPRAQAGDVATAITVRWDRPLQPTRRRLDRPGIVTTAIPWAGAVLADALGGYPLVFGLLAAIAAVLAAGNVPRSRESATRPTLIRLGATPISTHR